MPVSDDQVFVAAKTDVALDGLSPEHRLLYLIARQTGSDGLTGRELDDLYDGAVEAAGSVGAAIEAFESGRMCLEKHE
jgi:hypothetical protein